MKSINQLLQIIKKTPDCGVKPLEGLPDIEKIYSIPNDLVEFYTLCGGVSLYNTSAYSIEIVPPNRFVLANPAIFIGVDKDALEASKSDISWSWHIIGIGHNRQYITIDLAPERLGRCYDSYWDSHAMPGYSPIIAQSFTELIVRLIQNRGEHWYWLQPNFETIGDAYGGKSGG
jgi:hypothetical protein